MLPGAGHANANRLSLASVTYSDARLDAVKCAAMTLSLAQNVSSKCKKATVLSFKP